MLIRYTVSNFCSFKDEVELSMIPSRERAHKTQIYKPESRSCINLLKGAVVYGPNASGKSNLVRSMGFARDVILRGRPPNKRFNIPRFKLSPKMATAPSRFEFEIQCNGRMYAYGFELFDTHVHEEWLYLLKSGKETAIFERKSSGAGQEHSYTFGGFAEKLKPGEITLRDFVSKGTRKNQLFLPETVNRNLHFFADVYNWFDRTLRIITPTSKAMRIEFRLTRDEEFKDYLTDVLDVADTGINAIRALSVPASELSGIPEKMLEKLEEDLDEGDGALVGSQDNARPLVLKKHGGGILAYKLSTTRKSEESGEEVSFEMDEESDGTRRLIDLTPALYEMAYSKDARVFVIDEIDRSLHPHLSRLLVQKHLESEENALSQFIATTHETSLLDVSIIRRDEIWFMEKDEKGASQLYSLNNFKPRKDKAIRKDYLLGRYGAIPFVGDFKRLSR